MSDETKTKVRGATWHITDTLDQPVEVLREAPGEVQVRARQGVIWVPKTEVTYEAA